MTLTRLTRVTVYGHKCMTSLQKSVYLPVCIFQQQQLLESRDWHLYVRLSPFQGTQGSCKRLNYVIKYIFRSVCAYTWRYMNKSRHGSGEVLGPRCEGINYSPLPWWLYHPPSLHCLHITPGQGIRCSSTAFSLLTVSESCLETSLISSLPSELTLLKWLTWQIR